MFNGEPEQKKQGDALPPIRTGLDPGLYQVYVSLMQLLWRLIVSFCEYDPRMWIC